MNGIWEDVSSDAMTLLPVTPGVVAMQGTFWIAMGRRVRVSTVTEQLYSPYYYTPLHAHHACRRVLYTPRADVDECNKNNGGCQFTCVNTIGGFSCVCDPGYELSSDGTVCSGTNIKSLSQ